MTPRNLKILLAVSVAVNIFAVASGVALWVSRDKVQQFGAESQTSGRKESVQMLAAELNPQVRDRVMVELRAKAIEARPDFEEARSARREAIALTQQDQFRPVEVAALLERSRASEMRGRARLESGAVETLNRLSIADRKAMARILSRHRPRTASTPRPPSGSDQPSQSRLEGKAA